MLTHSLFKVGFNLFAGHVRSPYFVLVKARGDMWVVDNPAFTTTLALKL